MRRSDLQCRANQQRVYRSGILQTVFCKLTSLRDHHRIAPYNSEDVKQIGMQCFFFRVFRLSERLVRRTEQVADKWLKDRTFTRAEEPIVDVFDIF